MIEISNNADELSELAANRIIDLVQLTLAKHERFTIALSGGNTPRNIYRLLSTAKEKIDWSRLHIFWGDERVVPFNDNRNNAKMAFDSLLDHVPVPKNQIHVMRTDIDPVAAASAYEQSLRDYFPGENSFDLVLLGLGEDAHTLSLFPGSSIIDEKNSWVRAVYLKDQNVYRITLTAAPVNAAKAVYFIVSGTEKSRALKQVLEGEFDPIQYPAQVIQPVRGELRWLVDAAAASLLSKDSR